MNNYTVLHLHSDISNAVTNVDSITKFQEYIDKAASLNMSAMAFSEHGSVMAWYEKKCAIEKANMKYIHAEEFYITEKIETDQDGNIIKVRDNWHCWIGARNLEGVKELNRLSTKAFNRKDGHFFYNPRITLDELFSTSENLIITSACLGSPLNHGSEQVQKKFLKFFMENSDRCFLEIQHHNVIDQITYNQKLYNISQKLGLKLIAGTDTHSLDERQAKGRDMLQKGKGVNFDNESGWDMTFKSYEELCHAYEVQNAIPKEAYMEAINNTNLIADMVEPFEIDKNTKYPHIYNNPEQTFKDKINQAYKNHPYIKQNHDAKIIKQKIVEEYEVYKKTGAIDFMLLESYIREWERDNSIYSGYGRGSVSGSIIAYLLGITQMDSLKFDLNFFRFMNPDRVSNADIDTDYCGVDRDKIKYFLLHDKMNLPNIKTSEIITFNTIATKGAIKDIGRALNMDLNLTQELSNAVDINDEIPESVRKEYPKLCEYVDIVKGTIVSIGSHPSGVLVCDRDIESDIGLCTLGSSDYPVSMLDMHSLDTLMYVKLDILGLDNIGVINKTCELAGINRLTPDNVDLSDENVWHSIKDDTTLIFQWESENAAAFLKKFMSEETLKVAKEVNKNFSYIKWFSFGNGLIRPGCASFRDEVASGNSLKTGFKELDDFLAITFGRVTMQEDIMKFCKDFCGYSDAESDTVRRGIAKKKGTDTLLPEIEKRFIKYSHNTYKVDKELLQTIFPPIKQSILDASLYAFSWNHSDAYSCIGYISGYLRYYYPLEFITSAFNIFRDNILKIASITRYAEKINIQIKPPQFRFSSADYTMDKATNTIYKGLQSIKFMNAEVANKLYDMKDQKFDSFFDLLDVFPGNSRQLEILISLDFFKEFGKSGKLFKLYRIHNKYGGKKVIKKEDNDLPISVIQKYCDKETEKQFRFTNGIPNKMLDELSSVIENKSLPMATIIKSEQDYLGYISFKDPKINQCYYVVSELKVFHDRNKPYITLYRLNDGKTIQTRVKNANTFAQNPFNLYSILQVESLGVEYKKTRDEHGHWVDTDEQYTVLNYWDVVKY